MAKLCQSRLKRGSGFVLLSVLLITLALSLLAQASLERLWLEQKISVNFVHKLIRFESKPR